MRRTNTGKARRQGATLKLKRLTALHQPELVGVAKTKLVAR